MRSSSELDWKGSAMLLLLFVLQRKNRWSVDNTEDYLQVHSGQCSLASLHLLNHASAAKHVACMSCPVLHAFVCLSFAKLPLIICKENADALSD